MQSERIFQYKINTSKDMSVPNIQPVRTFQSTRSKSVRILRYKINTSEDISVPRDEVDSKPCLDVVPPNAAQVRHQFFAIVEVVPR